MGNQQRVLGIYNHQVLHAHQRHKLLWAVNIVIRGFKSHQPFGVGHVALRVSA